MFRIDNTRKNRNFLRLAALVAVVLLVTMFGGAGSPHRTGDLPHSTVAVEKGANPAEFQHQATQTQTAGSENNQLSLMIFRSN